MAERGLIDTHVHVWDPSVLRYPWLDDAPALNRPALPAQIDRDAGATGMLHVQAECEPGQAQAEVAWVRGLDWPELVGIVAYADLEAPDDAAVADTPSAPTPVVGVRQILRGWPTERVRALAPAFARLGSTGRTFDATVDRDQLPALAAAHARAPGATIVLDHLADPPLAESWSSPEAAAWRDGVRAVAEHPRAVVKVSGLPADARRGPAWAHSERFVRHALEVFGADRTMLGSDWPVTGPVAGGGVPWHRVLDAALAGDPAAIVRVRSGTAETIYGLGRPARAGKDSTA